MVLDKSGAISDKGENMGIWVVQGSYGSWSTNTDHRCIGYPTLATWGQHLAHHVLFLNTCKGGCT